MAQDVIATARAVFKAFEDKDREAIERLIADEFSFTSPFDNRLDRDTYFERCWPNAEAAETFTVIFAAADGNRCAVTYEATTLDGDSFRNTEVFTVVGGQVTEVEVYFGWNLPHDAEEGEWVEDDEEED
jgi:ketosteroid isomerase-like protein